MRGCQCAGSEWAAVNMKNDSEAASDWDYGMALDDMVWFLMQACANRSDEHSMSILSKTTSKSKRQQKAGC